MSDLLILPTGSPSRSAKGTVAMSRPMEQPKGCPTIEWLRSVMIGPFIGYTVLVTPEMAERFLEANTLNRAVRRMHLRRLKAAMIQDEWYLTHQGVAFSKTGVLLDGQHRLMAILASGVSVPLQIFVEMDDNSRPLIDTGKPREMRDQLLDEDPAYIDVCNYLAALMITNESRPPSSAEVQELIDALRADLDALQAAATSRVKGRTTSSIRASWVLRHHFATKSQRVFLKDQWAAFVNFKPKDMDGQTSAMLTRLDHLKTQGGSAQRERGLVAWIGFDPINRGRTKIQITGDGALKQVRAAIADLLEEDEED